MRAFIRVDSGPLIGSGHVSRCLVLGAALAQAGADVHMISATLYESDKARAQQLGFPVHELAQPGNQQRDAKYSIEVIERLGGGQLLIVDNYNLDLTWETQLRGCTQQILVIDDLHDRAHDCDYLVDSGVDEKLHNPYVRLSPSNTQFWLGLGALMISNGVSREGQVPAPEGGRRFLVWLGGGSSPKTLQRAIEGVLFVCRGDDQILVVDRSLSTDIDKLKLPKHPQIQYLEHIHDPFSVYQTSDLCVGTAGVSAWERVRARLPSVVAVGAANQSASAERLNENGVIKMVGDLAKVDPTDWADGLISLLQPQRYSATVRACASLEKQIGYEVPALVQSLVRGST